MVTMQSHREALTSITLSTHRLALEKLRHTDHAHRPVPRNERLCRFCDVVESPEHALLECIASPEVVALRSGFLPKLLSTVPKLQTKMAQLSSVDFLKAIIFERSTILLVGKFVHEVFEVFYAVPLRRPAV